MHLCWEVEREGKILDQLAQAERDKAAALMPQLMPLSWSHGSETNRRWPAIGDLISPKHELAVHLRSFDSPQSYGPNWARRYSSRAPSREACGRQRPQP